MDGSESHPGYRAVADLSIEVAPRCSFPRWIKDNHGPSTVVMVVECLRTQESEGLKERELGRADSRPRIHAF